LDFLPVDLYERARNSLRQIFGTAVVWMNAIIAEA